MIFHLSPPEGLQFRWNPDRFSGATNLLFLFVGVHGDKMTRDKPPTLNDVKKALGEMGVREKHFPSDKKLLKRLNDHPKQSPETHAKFWISRNKSLKNRGMLDEIRDRDRRNDSNR